MNIVHFKNRIGDSYWKEVNEQCPASGVDKNILKL